MQVGTYPPRKEEIKEEKVIMGPVQSTYHTSYDFLVTLLGEEVQGDILLEIIQGGPSRVPWLISFVEHEGYMFILNKIQQIMARINFGDCRGTEKDLSNFEKHVLVGMIRIQLQFVVAAYVASDPSLMPKVEIVKRNSMDADQQIGEPSEE